MNVILVPAPPKEAFHKLRPISDLIKAQVDHFKHLEEKLSAKEKETVPQHRIVTENDAALYVGAMTRLLRSGQKGPADAKPVAIIDRSRAKARPAEGLRLAASAQKATPAARNPRPKPAAKNKRKK